jgi:hypothetical protein
MTREQNNIIKYLLPVANPNSVSIGHSSKTRWTYGQGSATYLPLTSTHNIHSGVFVNSTNLIVDFHRTYYLLFYPVAMISPTMAHQQPVHLVEESSGDEEDGVSDDHESTTETSAKEASIASSATPVLAHQETKAVNRSKILVYLVLLAAAAAAGTATYYFLAIEEQDNFESEVSYVFLLPSCDFTRC